MKGTDADIEAALEHAFAYESDTGASGSTHAEFVRLRRDLPLLSPKSLRSVLPAVLVELLRSHTDDRSNDEGAEAVVLYLDVQCDYPDEASDRERFGPSAANTAKEGLGHLRAAKAKTFADFTPEQARAILAWLENARNWGDLYYCKRELESAITYWATKASGSSKTE